ncbi:hypothetical protein RE428_06580 [Marinobacter nanhaiticus D15-8W]|nr:hypothetical protein [Marinobacter nanhaiticus]BES69640.1 hypothetical protein RE428_06580 [Marinobacter nanhaiticus D15-8W]
MLYEVASPLFTVAGLSVLFGVVYSAKCFFDNRMAELDQKDDGKTPATGA